jgi:putative transposase
MIRLFLAAFAALVSGFRSQRGLVIENLALRQQLSTMLQKHKPRIRPVDRVFWVLLRRAWARWSDAVVIVKPETVIGWHRAGFALY